MYSLFYRIFKETGSTTPVTVIEVDLEGKQCVCLLLLSSILLHFFFLTFQNERVENSTVVKKILQCKIPRKHESNMFLRKKWPASLSHYTRNNHSSLFSERASIRVDCKYH